MKVLITIGHGTREEGGYNPGACAFGYEEFKLAREVGKWCQAHLNNNYDVKCDLWNYNGDLDLTERINKLQDNTYDYVAEMHLNAGKGTGSEVYCYNTSDKGYTVAKAICEKLCSEFGWRNRGAKVSGGNYGIVDRTVPVSNLVEICFIDTLEDVKKVVDNNGQLKAGQMVAEGIAKGLGLKRKGESQPSKPSTPQNKTQHLKGTIITDYLTMRDRPDMYANAIRKLPNGYFFTVLYMENGWFKINHAGTEGWIICDDNYVKVEDLNNGNKVIKYGTPVTGNKKTAQDLTAIAQEVIDGKWGNGDDRKNRLKQAGYNPDEVQAKVNEIIYG